jgi:hypothetical protein
MSDVSESAEKGLKRLRNIIYCTTGVKVTNQVIAIILSHKFEGK